MGYTLGTLTNCSHTYFVIHENHNIMNKYSKEIFKIYYKRHTFTKGRILFRTQESIRMGNSFPLDVFKYIFLSVRNSL